VLQRPGEIRSRVQMRELGAIPWARSVPDSLPHQTKQGNLLFDAAFGRQAVRRNATAETVVWEDQASLLAEAFRDAATSLLLARNTAKPQAVVITSAHRGEGKTTAVLNLAAALADLNLKVLILDADLRHPRLHQILELPNSWGLSDLLQEKIMLRDAPVEALVRSCSIPNVAVVCAGPPALNVGGLLYSDQMEQLMTRFRREFDVILIDTPPALLLADARLVSRLADAVALVVQAGRTTESEIAYLRDKLSEDGQVLAGALLNGWHYDHSAAPVAHGEFHA
jgi:capsular exopolysaccharide synthesis family protein